jgi:hypothetical protein
MGPMNSSDLGEISAEQQGLRMVVVITMPDSLLYDYWRRSDIHNDPDHVAACLGDLVRTNYQVLKVVDAPMDEIWTVIESPSALVVVKEFNLSYALGGIFGPETTQGAARLSVKRLIKHLSAVLVPAGVASI